MAQSDDVITTWIGRHLSMFVRGKWEFVSRNTQKPVVGVVAITRDREVVLVEQYRPPVDQYVIELPAGLAGDLAGAERETLVDAAKRELREETGYAAARWTELGRGFSSPGLTDESIVLFLAEDLERCGPGGGDDSEAIRIHEVPLDGIRQWLDEHHAGAVDLKLLAGLYAAQQHLDHQSNESHGGQHGVIAAGP